MIDWRSYRASVDEVAWRTITAQQDATLLAALTLGYPSWQTLVRGARALDRVVAPGLGAQPVRAPVFVVGHPRSGTTFLHRLLALDPRFTAPLAWQLALPAVSLYRAVGVAGRLHVGGRLAGSLERRLLEPMAPRHESAWTVPEEDDWLFVHAAASPTLAYLTKRPDICRPYWIGDSLPGDVRGKLMRWYRRSIQRHLYATGGSATLLSKNPHFTGWLRTLNITFPDARFVMLQRHPADAIASRLDMLAKAWGVRRPSGHPQLRRELEASLDLYRHAEGVWPELPAESRIRVGFDDLVRQPLAELERIYDRLGWPIDAALRTRWHDAADLARRRVPSPPTRLRHFGVRRSEVTEALSGLDALWATVGERR